MPLYGRSKRKTIINSDVGFNGQNIPIETTESTPLRPIEFVNAIPNENNNELIIKALSYATDTPIPVSRFPSLGLERTVPAPLFLGKPNKPNDQFLYTNPDYVLSDGFFNSTYDTQCIEHFLFAHIHSKTYNAPIGIPKKITTEGGVVNGTDGVIPLKGQSNYEVTFVEQSSDFSEIKISGLDLKVRGNNSGGVQLVSNKTYEYDNWYNGDYNNYVTTDKVALGYTNDSLVKYNIGDRYEWSHGTIWFVASFKGPPAQTSACPTVVCDNLVGRLSDCESLKVCAPCPEGYLCPPTQCKPFNNNNNSECDKLTLKEMIIPNTSTNDPFYGNFNDIENKHYYQCDTTNCIPCINTIDCNNCDSNINPECQPPCPDCVECCDESSCVDCGVWAYYINIDYFLDNNLSIGLGNLNAATFDLSGNFSNNVIDVNTYINSATEIIVPQIEKLKDCDPFKLNLCNLKLRIDEIITNSNNNSSEQDIDYKCNIRRVNTTTITDSTTSSGLDNIIECDIRTINDYLIDFAIIVANVNVDGTENILNVSSIQYGNNRIEKVWKNSPEKYKVYLAYNKNGILTNIELGQIINNNGTTKFIDVTDLSLKIVKLDKVDSCRDINGNPCVKSNFSISCSNVGCVHGFTQDNDSWNSIYQKIIQETGDCFKVSTENLLTSIPDNYTTEWDGLQYVVKDFKDEVVDFYYDDVWVISGGYVDFTASLQNTIGNDISNIVEWKLYEITENINSFGLYETILISQGLGTKFIYEFTEPQNKKYELIAYYNNRDSFYSTPYTQQSNINDCRYVETKIIKLNYQHGWGVSSELSIECDFLKLPEQRNEIEEQIYINAIEEYENSLAYNTHKDKVSDSTHHNTDYTSCSYGNSLLLIEQSLTSGTSSVGIETLNDILLFSDKDGFLGHSQLYEIDNESVHGLETILSNGKHILTSVSLYNCSYYLSSKEINIIDPEEDCETYWNGKGFDELNSQRWVEAAHNYLEDEIKLSALYNYPYTLEDNECFRFNTPRWSEINNLTYNSLFDDTKFISENEFCGRINPLFVFNSIKSGRCITFTNGSDDSNAIKINVDFLKDPDEPCCDCTQNSPVCETDCSKGDDWETTGRDEDGCIEWVDPDGQNILQPTKPGQWVQQIKPSEFNNNPNSGTFITQPFNQEAIIIQNTETINNN